MSRLLLKDIVLPCQEVLLDMHMRGILVDQKRQAELKMEVESRLFGLVRRVNLVAEEEVEKIKPEKTEFLRCADHPEYRGKTKRTACSVCENIWLDLKSWKGRKDVKDYERFEKFNVGSPLHKAWLLFSALGLPVVETTKTKIPSVKVGALEEILEVRVVGRREQETLEDLIEISHLQHQLNVDLNPPVGEDGRHHPIYTAEATSIGRLRSGSQKFDADKINKDKFNIMGVPEGARQIYKADPGFVFVSLDAAQIEWALMMLLARCKRGLEAYADPDRDIHTENARDIVVPLLFGEDWESLSKEEKKARRRVTKRFTHSLDYVATVYGLAKTFSVKRELAAKASRAYFERWPEIRVWQQEVEEAALRGRSLRNPFGRMRRFLDVTSKRRGGKKVLVLDHKQIKQAMAFGPASTNADIWKLNCRALFDAGFVQLLGTHDDHLLMIKDDSKVEDKIKEALRICERPIPELAEFNKGVAWSPRFSISSGRNWGPWHETKNLEGLREIEV